MRFYLSYSWYPDSIWYRIDVCPMGLTSGQHRANVAFYQGRPIGESTVVRGSWIRLPSTIYPDNTLNRLHVSSMSAWNQPHQSNATEMLADRAWYLRWGISFLEIMRICLVCIESELKASLFMRRDLTTGCISQQTRHQFYDERSICGMNDGQIGAFRVLPFSSIQ